MVCGTFKLKKIASDEVDGVVERFKVNDPAPLSVTKTQEQDGTFTVTATFPPCPPNTTHNTG
jgi:hypothetical protein